MILRFARKNSFAIVLLVSAILLSVASVHAQVEYLGVRFLKVQQEKAHEQMMAGIAGNPWQYRILADLLVEPLIILFKEMDLVRPPATAFIVFRFVQNLLIFLLAGIYHKKTGLEHLRQFDRPFPLGLRHVAVAL
jgi:putative copper export protein